MIYYRIGINLSKMIKLKDLVNNDIKEWDDTSFKKIPKRWGKPYDQKYTDFENKNVISRLKKEEKLNEDKSGSIYDMKKQIKDGTFDPKNPEVLIHGWGRLSLKSLERMISKQLSDLANAAKMGGELKIKNIDSLLFKKHSVLQSKIKAANDVYQQMNSSQYKRAVTIYKKNK